MKARARGGQAAALRVEQGGGHRFVGELRQHFDKAAVGQQQRAGAWHLDQPESYKASAERSFGAVDGDHASHGWGAIAVLRRIFEKLGGCAPRVET
jgi:hypothetical protein